MGVAVGGADFIWSEEHPDLKTVEPYCLEVSPTSDINPTPPSDFKEAYANFKKHKNFRREYLTVRRQWTEAMLLAVLDRYRCQRRHLFVDIDNVISESWPRVLRWKGGKKAYFAEEVLKDKPLPDAADSLRELRKSFFIRLLTARGSYEDPFNVTQTWLDRHGFEYDELIVVNKAEDKLAHLTSDALLLDDFTAGHETETPWVKEDFVQKLKDAGLPTFTFPMGGPWKDVMPALLSEVRHANSLCAA